jgi:hypothetical protein
MPARGLDSTAVIPGEAARTQLAPPLNLRNHQSSYQYSLTGAENSGGRNE